MEEKLRLSKEGQARFAAVEAGISGRDWMDVALDMQHEIARELVGEARAVEFAHLVRFTPTNNIPHWKRYNRADRGHLQIGNPYTDCILYNSKSTENYTTMGELLDVSHRTVIIASSGS